MAILGIDLGTTNSLGAVYRNGQVELIPNRFGTFLTPSVVSIDQNNNILVGQIAKERLVSNPEHTVFSFKKDMGTDKRYRLGEKLFAPEELSSFVIRSIVEDAKEYLQEEIEEVIISVPAYFNDKQRVATKKAGALAGVITNRIINEPSAAAMASYFDTSKAQLFLVFDFGGGTLDVSVVECFDTVVEILSVAGDNHLGGDDFHEIMAKSFLKEHSIKKIGPKEYSILLRQAEICKRKLTTEKSAKMTAVINGQMLQSEYTNQRLLEESGKIFERIKEVLGRAITDGEIALDDINAIVMVGGSSKMPLIQSYLYHILKQKPIVTGNCDEMIARGLGLVCGVKARQGDIKDYILTDICPFTLGTSVNNEADAKRPYMYPIVPRNTVLPCSIVRRFYTSRDNQEILEVDVLQGEQIYADENLSLNTMRLSVPKGPKGKESIDVRFTYDINGILLVDVTVVSTGEKISKVVSQNVSAEDMQKKIKELEELKVHPKDISENRLIMEKMVSLYEEVPIYLRENISSMIAGFERILEEQNPRKIKKYREYVIGAIEAYESASLFDEGVIFDTFDENWDADSEENFDEAEFDFYNMLSGGSKWTS